MSATEMARIAKDRPQDQRLADLVIHRSAKTVHHVMKHAAVKSVAQMPTAAAHAPKAEGLITEAVTIAVHSRKCTAHVIMAKIATTAEEAKISLVTA